MLGGHNMGGTRRTSTVVQRRPIGGLPGWIGEAEPAVNPPAGDLSVIVTKGG